MKGNNVSYQEVTKMFSIVGEVFLRDSANVDFIAVWHDKQNEYGNPYFKVGVYDLELEKLRWSSKSLNIEVLEGELILKGKLIEHDKDFINVDLLFNVLEDDFEVTFSFIQVNQNFDEKIYSSQEVNEKIKTKNVQLGSPLMLTRNGNQGMGRVGAFVKFKESKDLYILTSGHIAEYEWLVNGKKVIPQYGDKMNSPFHTGKPIGELYYHKNDQFEDIALVKVTDLNRVDFNNSCNVDLVFDSKVIVSENQEVFFCYKGIIEKKAKVKALYCVKRKKRDSNLLLIGRIQTELFAIHTDSGSIAYDSNKNAIGLVDEVHKFGDFNYLMSLRILEKTIKKQWPTGEEISLTFKSFANIKNNLNNSRMDTRNQDEKSARITLSYDFDSYAAHNDKFQGIYYGHFYGTTFTIGAKFIIQEMNDGKIVKIKAKFISEILGGIMNFALHSIDGAIKPSESSNTSDGSAVTHELFFRLNIIKAKDAINNPIELIFEHPFDMKKDILQVKPLQNPRKFIANLVKGMLFDDKSSVNIDDLRSCDVGLGNG